MTDPEYRPTVWAGGKVRQEAVHISAAKLQSGGYAVWMGMYAPVSGMRAAVGFRLGILLNNRVTDRIATDAVVMRSTAGMLRAGAFGDDCSEQPAGVA